MFNSLAPGMCELKFESVFVFCVKFVFGIVILNNSSATALMKMQRNKPEIKPMLTKYYGVIWS